jgi:hypothetical protein
MLIISGTLTANSLDVQQVINHKPNGAGHSFFPSRTELITDSLALRIRLPNMEQKVPMNGTGCGENPRTPPAEE